MFKTDSAQSSSNNCKNYLLKIYSQHINVLYTIWNLPLYMYFISPGDPAMKIPSVLEKFHVNPRKNASCLCFQPTRNVHFKWTDMCNFKFNFHSQGQLESLNLDRIFLLFIQNITMLWGFFGSLIFAIIARILSGNHLNIFHSIQSDMALGIVTPFSWIWILSFLITYVDVRTVKFFPPA